MSFKPQHLLPTDSWELLQHPFKLPFGDPTLQEGGCQLELKSTRREIQRLNTKNDTAFLLQLTNSCLVTLPLRRGGGWVVFITLLWDRASVIQVRALQQYSTLEKYSKQTELNWVLRRKIVRLQRNQMHHSVFTRWVYLYFQGAVYCD